MMAIAFALDEMVLVCESRDKCGKVLCWAKRVRVELGMEVKVDVTAKVRNEEMWSEKKGGKFSLEESPTPLNYMQKNALSPLSQRECKRKRYPSIKDFFCLKETG